VSFWHDIPQPIIGLSPMDGVTDPAFWYIVAWHGKPDVQVTEFINVDEVCHGGEAADQIGMNPALLQGLSARLTLGEAVAQAKAVARDQNVRRTWMLFGDPTTRLK